jgi:hypothetical protein
MQVGDLVRLSESFSNPAAILDWGFGLIDKVHNQYFSVTVIWPQKSYNSTKLPWSRVEVVSENR